MVISVLLDDVDGLLRAVGRGEACVLLPARRHSTIAGQRGVAVLVLAEQVGSEVVATAVALATFGVDPHSHETVPICVAVVGARAVTTRARRVAHSRSSTSLRS